MTKVNLCISAMLAMVLLISATEKLSGQEYKGDSKAIIEAETQAMDKWINRNVWGFLNLFAADATYFDTETKMRLNGYKEIEAYIAPWNGQIYAPRYEMVNVDIKVNGSSGVLTYNLYNFGESGDTTALWNSTEIYQKIEGDWKIIHSHWSLVDIGKQVK